MDACRVFIGEAPSEEDIQILPEGMKLKAIPSAGTRQVVIDMLDGQPLSFSVFNAATSLPANVMGFPVFLILQDKLGNCVGKVQGSTTSTTFGAVLFSPSKLSNVMVGFYNYRISIGCAILAEGSCVVR